MARTKMAGNAAVPKHKPVARFGSKTAGTKSPVSAAVPSGADQIKMTLDVEVKALGAKWFRSNDLDIRVSKERYMGTEHLCVHIFASTKSVVVSAKMEALGWEADILADVLHPKHLGTGRGLMKCSEIQHLGNLQISLEINQHIYTASLLHFSAMHVTRILAGTQHISPVATSVIYSLKRV
ncbi:uncharacterized protein LOC129574270 [Sitodiplosis mosellana]|uniref:uncharacterized protein LOC129574270 n=1 Tax=Sitodiplosis mosellana TaxID=263140 RepID=UPI002444BC94|nr:uncharacterized protein LOC129574270 [Sitodiplosis mosellana]